MYQTLVNACFHKLLKLKLYRRSIALLRLANLITLLILVYYYYYYARCSSDHEPLQIEILVLTQEKKRNIETINRLKKSNKDKQNKYDNLKQKYDLLQMENAFIDIKNAKQTYKKQCERLQTKIEQYKSQCIRLQNDKIELQNKSEEYERKYNALQKEIKETYKATHFQSADTQKNELQNKHSKHKKQQQNSQPLIFESKQSTQITEITELKCEIKNMKIQNNKLKDQLQQTTMGKGIESNFIKEEDFATKKIHPFRQQLFKNMHDDIVDELIEIYENELDVEDDDEYEHTESDEHNSDDQFETNTKSKFELLMDRIGYEFLFDLLILSYDVMLNRKTNIIHIIAKQLNIKNNKEQSAEEIAEIIIHTQLQQQWEDYLQNKMENIYGINVDEINEVIEDICTQICMQNKYRNWRFLQIKYKKQMKQYIWKCCEICWIMILTKPRLTFYPNSFRMCVKDKTNEYLYNAKDKHKLWTGSITKNNAKIVFFAMPAVVQNHFMNKKQKIQIIKGTVFAHNDKELMKYIMSDPQQLIAVKVYGYIRLMQQKYRDHMIDIPNEIIQTIILFYFQVS